MLDSRSFSSPRSPSSWALSFVWPSIQNHWSSPHWMCLHKRVLVPILVTSWPTIPLLGPLNYPFLDWWDRATSGTSDRISHGINSLIILGAGLYGLIATGVFLMEQPLILEELWSLLEMSINYGRWLGPEVFPSWLPPMQNARILELLLVASWNIFSGALTS